VLSTAVNDSTTNSNNGNGLTLEGQNCLAALHMNGLETLQYQGASSSHIFVLVRANLEVIKNYADDIDYPMLLNRETLRDIATRGNLEQHIASVEISHIPEMSKFLPYEYIYGKFSLRMPEELYKRRRGEDTAFSNIIRIKLTEQLIEKDLTQPNEFNIKNVRESSALVTSFPLHCPTTLESLRKSWLKYPIIPWNQPFEQLRRYFGEKIALYFVFLGHYSWWCVAAAVVGTPMQLAVFATGDYSAPYLPCFSYFIALWGVLMLEFWKRKESEWAMKWGTLGCEVTEIDRPEFVGVAIKSYVNGREMMYFSNQKRRRYIQQSLIGICVLVTMVVGAIASIYVIRFTIRPFVGSFAQTIASIINSLQIQCTSVLYYNLAVGLNDRENHRTETMYEDSLITKIFLFEFVNNYASFFYLAFLAELMTDECPSSADGGCMVPLALNLGIVFISRLIVGNICELLLPYLSYRWRVRRALQSTHSESETKLLSLLTRPEKEYMLEPYDSHSASIADFMELAIQFGYASMFAAALPMSPLLSLISNFVETTADAYKLLNVHRRPQPQSCEDIGTWQSIFTIISIISVITNSSVSVFTMSVTDSLGDFTRFWVYIAFQWSCFLIQVSIMCGLNDVTDDVKVQTQRTTFLVDKVIDQTPDDVITHYVPYDVDPSSEGNTARSLSQKQTAHHDAHIQANPIREKISLTLPQTRLKVKEQVRKSTKNAAADATKSDSKIKPAVPSADSTDYQLFHTAVVLEALIVSPPGKNDQSVDTLIDL
jgi:hypothetical protein